ncbi:hypothetical protein POX_b02869 [Penicillium oxalicum]|uniref:hypothetical protein n=1 Tax=Penicillium oxalicum TaxID=69781 RepID=UPI0020B639AC|nr:hypothetical protein POX_b02869 [Penicillium oxalicum]KAI2792826.1 hypothetical protein POX_b02869 [Penicillium oxalicum]
MRSIIATLFLATTALASTSATDDFIRCATAAMNNIGGSKLTDCTSLSSTACLCANKDTLLSLSDATKAACSGSSFDVAALASSACGSGTSSTARHAGQPMEPARQMIERAYSPSMEDSVATSVVWVTETRTDCSCKSTSLPFDHAHVSQIPVNVPMASSMSSGVAAYATPASSASWSAMYSSHISVATPGPSGASSGQYYPFEGAAPRVNALKSGLAAVGVAAVMGLVAAL